MMTLAAVASAVVGTLLAVTWWRGRSRGLVRRRPEIYVLLHDGVSTWLMPGQRLETGSISCGGAEYPAGIARLVDDTIGLGSPLYLVAVEPIALTKHRTLEQYRASVIKGALFKTGGDMVEMVRIAAACAVIACAIFVYMAVGSLNSTLVQQQAKIDKLDAVLSKPLVVEALK